MNFVELEGSPLFLSLIQDQSLWEAYDLVEEKWKLLSDNATLMFCAYPYPYPVSFDHSMRECVKDLPDDVTVVYYSSNESFGAIRMSDFDYGTWEMGTLWACEDVCSARKAVRWYKRNPPSLREAMIKLEKQIRTGSAYYEHAKDSLVPDRPRMRVVLTMAELIYGG